MHNRNFLQVNQNIQNNGTIEKQVNIGSTALAYNYAGSRQQ